MKYCVIGLGRFGYQVATKLAEQDKDVLAIDSNESIIASIRDKVTHAICMKVTSEESLRSVGIEDMDMVIVSMGENFAQSILITALLKQRLKVPRVITRSVSEIHKEILELIGADRVVLPEKEAGLQLADQLCASFDMLAHLTPKYSITQIKIPKDFVGKTVNDLDLLEKYQVNCLGKKVAGEIVHLKPNEILSSETILVVSGSDDAVSKLFKLK